MQELKGNFVFISCIPTLSEDFSIIVQEFMRPFQSSLPK